MRKTIKSEVEQEIEIDFPIIKKFTKGIYLYFDGEEVNLMVRENGISPLHPDIFGYDMMLSYEDATFAEFEEVYKNALNNLTIQAHDLFAKENEFIKDESLKFEGH